MMAAATLGNSSMSNAHERFVVLAKSAPGLAVTMVIDQALSAPDLFVFSELLELPNIQQLLLWCADVTAHVLNSR
eukprot:m.172388 g.172388  ORF g.172388 m.172388 type:complete len:75 (-) comp18286_c0_seq1:1513-1737(-)